MKFHGYIGLCAAACLMLAGCDDTGEDEADTPPVASSASDTQAQPPAEKDGVEPPATAAPDDSAAPAGPPAAFRQCRSCHSIEPGKNGIGPSLAGIFGKPAAGVEGYKYSPALRASGIVWNWEEMDQWLAAPARMVPGSKMVQMVRNDDQRKALVDYLETLN